MERKPFKFEKHEGWKATHQLVLDTYTALDKLKEEQMDDVLHRLGYCALRANGRIAFGFGTGVFKMRYHAIFCALAWLHEYGEMLSLARVMGTLPVEVCDQLGALRGRAALYTEKLLEPKLPD